METILYPAISVMLLGSSTWFLWKSDEHAWANPQIILGASWCLFELLTCLFGIGYRNSPATLIPVFGILLFQFGTLVIPQDKTVTLPTNHFTFHQLGSFVTFAAIVAVIGLYSHLKSGSVDISQIQSDGVGDSSAKLAALQYAGEMEGTPISRVSLSIHLGAALAAGIYRGLRPRDRGHNVLLLVLISPTVLWTALTTTRSFIFVPVMNYISGFLCGVILAGYSEALDWAKIRTRAAIVIPVVFAAIFVPAMYRYQKSSGMGETFERVCIWLGGPNAVFCAWYDTTYSKSAERESNPLTTPILRVLGIDKGPAEGYNPDLNFPLGWGGHYGNASTVAKPMIIQFGLFGAAAAMMVFGLVLAIMVKAARRGSVAACWILVIAYNAILFSTNYWYYQQGRRLLAIPVFVLYMICFVRRTDEPTDELAQVT